MQLHVGGGNMLSSLPGGLEPPSSLAVATAQISNDRRVKFTLNFRPGYTLKARKQRGKTCTTAVQQHQSARSHGLLRGLGGFGFIEVYPQACLNWLITPTQFSSANQLLRDRMTVP
jgi:hypothetical protein